MSEFTGIAHDLHRYLQESRESLVASLDGLTEYDIRRPMTPTATNLLGLVKHLVGIEFGYLGDSVGRPAPVVLPWVEDGTIWDGADMWATADETREELVGLYKTAWKHSDESIGELPLDAPAEVAWWPEEKRRTTFRDVLVRTVAETAHHAGHADIVREMIDGRGGRDHDDTGGQEWWDRFTEQVKSAADHYRPTSRGE
ncbi:DinB family protein [Kibdelosporangium lantanae]|uniref:DinB family protein n=1 Tax=Kibdelosporangium lantanae TaxID=1497396 RepID=A0ABW3M624_9PSEU